MDDMKGDFLTKVHITDDVYALQERIDLIGSLEFSPYNIDDDVNWLDDDERDDCHRII